MIPDVTPPTTLDLASSLRLPAAEAIAQKYAFVGRSGSGKSYAAMRLAELMLDVGAQVVALDWVGIWWSLRLARDGRGPGFPHVYIFGGESADVPLEPTAGKLLADLVVDRRISAVFDLMHFRKADRTRFATAFAEQLFHRKKTSRSPIHLFLEEAQAYLPQFVKGEDARMVGVFEDIGKVGRNYGIGNSIITQRPQAVNKDVLNQAEVLLAFQTSGPQERKALQGWIAENASVSETKLTDELPSLRTGECWVWSPSWLRSLAKHQISRRITYDASSTPTQAAGKLVAPKALSPSELENLGTEIASTLERQRENDPSALKQRIADLERQVKAGAPSEAQQKRVSELRDQVAELQKALKLKTEDAINRLAPILAGLAREREQLQNIATVLAQASPRVMENQPRMSESDRQQRTPAVVTPPSQHKRTITERLVAAGTSELNAKQTLMLRALRTCRERLGIEQLTRPELAAFSNQSPKSSAFDVNLRALSQGGYVSYPASGIVQLTDMGSAIAGTSDDTPSNLVDALCKYALSESQAKLLRVLEHQPHQSFTRQALADHANRSATSSAYDVDLRQLSRFNVITYPEKGMVALHPRMRQWCQP